MNLGIFQIYCRTNLECEEIQKLLFKLGYSWSHYNKCVYDFKNHVPIYIISTPMLDNEFELSWTINDKNSDIYNKYNGVSLLRKFKMMEIK